MRAIVALLFVSLLGCELAGLTNPMQSSLPPVVKLNGNTLTRSPTAQQIAAYYCPQVIGDPITALACEATLGTPLPKQEMRFDFELHYLIDNPNQFPLPTTEILAAIDVFRGAEQSGLGAVCVVLCNEGDVACTGAPGPGSCHADKNDIKSIDDFKDRIAGLLIVAAVDAATGNLDNLRVRSIPAGSQHFEVIVRFSLGIDAMVDLLTTFVSGLVDKFMANQPIVLEIPYSVRGTLWFEIPILGRVAIGYGPFEQTWVIE